MDHGVSFQPGTARRGIQRANVGEIAAVPLFIKVPGKQEGGIDDRPVELIDVLPTIADVLRVRVPWRTDGASLFAAGFPARVTKAIRSRDPISFPADGEEKLAAVRRKFELFWSEGDSLRPFIFRAHADLYGKRAMALVAGREAGARAILDHSEAFQRVDPLAPLLPSAVTGQVVAPGRILQGRSVAIAVNGTVWAVAPIHRGAGREHHFAAILSPAAFVEGSNKVAVFLVRQGPGRSVLNEFG